MGNTLGPVSPAWGHSRRRTNYQKKASALWGLKPDGWPLRGGLVGGKFGGIDLRSRLVLLFRAVEFEDTVDVDLGDTTLDGRGRFLRSVFLIFAVAQLTLDLDVSLSAGSIYPQQDALLFYPPGH